MTTSRRLLVSSALLGLAALVGWNSPIAAQSTKPPVFADFKSKLALDGHDAVAYFRSGKPVKGVDAHAVSWNGATWRFASAENKAAFEANPQAFAPQYGGYCAGPSRKATPPRATPPRGASSMASST